MLVFYALPVSGYCTKVRIVLRKKGIPFEERVPHGGSYSTDAYRQAMPPGTIPSVDDDGFKLFDSEAIAEYLNERFPSPPLLANNLEQRARQRALSHFHNGRLEPTVRALFPLVKSKDKSIGSGVVDTAADAFVNQLLMLERVAVLRPWISGEAMCIADCAFPVTIAMGQDILRWLGVSTTLTTGVSKYLETAFCDDVVGEELVANRAAVAEWLEKMESDK